MSAYMLIYGYIQVSASHAFDFHGRQAALDKLNNMKVQVHDHNKLCMNKDFIYLSSIQVGTPDILQDRKFLKIMYKVGFHAFSKEATNGNVSFQDFQVQKTDFFQNILYGMTFTRFMKIILPFS